MIARIIMLALLCLPFRLFAQSATFTFEGKNMRLSKVFTAIKKQTGFSFFYTDSRNYGDSLISIHADQMQVSQFLVICQKRFPLLFEINSSVIVVHTREPAPPPVTAPQKINLSGIARDEEGNVLQGVNITAKNGQFIGETDEKGRFSLTGLLQGSSLLFTFVDKDTLVQTAGKDFPAVITLTTSRHTLGTVAVEYSTGYEKVPLGYGTGSFSLVDNKLFSRNPSSFVIDRLENTVSGLYYPHGSAMPGYNQPNSGILLRGPSTITANPALLLVVDNFPYEGNIQNINPDDIENVTVLKDAAAAAIWGARAGNGVVVLTTKKGKEPGLHVTFNNSLLIQGRPDVDNIQTISPKDFIDFENYLFSNGFYDGALNNPSSIAPVTPVVALLDQARKDPSMNAVVQQMIDSIGRHDVRDDIRRYFYRPSIQNRHFIQLSGRNERAAYYLSAGWDHQLPSLEGTRYDRLSFRTLNSFTLSSRLQAEAGVQFSESYSHSGANPGDSYSGPSLGESFYPYANFGSLKNPLPLYLNYSPAFIAKSMQQGFLDETYRPLQDLSAEHDLVTTTDLLLTTGLAYRLSPAWRLELKYQQEEEQITDNTLYDAQSYYARNLENQFTQLDPGTNTLSYPVPLGDIFNQSRQQLSSQQGRIQLNYHHSNQHQGEWTAIGGLELRSMVDKGNSERYYGYDPSNLTIGPALNYAMLYAIWPTGDSSAIPPNPKPTQTTDHFFSAYTNLIYTYAHRYSASASLREDEANLFGASTNRKGIPLWSGGFSWLASRESFYPLSFLPVLKWRVTYGSSGNISRQASAYTTATAFTGSVGNPQSDFDFIQTLANDNLRWEQTSILNLGADFSTRDNRLTGSLDYYKKNSRYLVALTPLDPTYGLTVNPGTISSTYANSAALTGQGFDADLRSQNIVGRFSWTTSWLFSYSTSRVTRYLMPPGLGNTYKNPYTSAPVVGRPLDGLYSFKWRGLNASGDPVGSYGGKPSTDWHSIFYNTALDSMDYNGTTRPRFFGALRNTFAFGAFSLSATISYQLGYVFRKDGLEYKQLANQWTGSNDYTRRWKKPGDEKITNVPSLTYPLNPDRDNFYINSSALVQKAGNIRLQDILLNYDLGSSPEHKYSFQHIRLYLYCKNAAMLWAANHAHVDPFYNNISREQPSYTLGLNLNF